MFLQTLDGSNFLAANLYARSVFSEDALVNVSVEKKEDSDGKLSGYIRIRSKTQGIALSLGDRWDVFRCLQCYEVLSVVTMVVFVYLMCRITSIQRAAATVEQA